MTKSCTEVSCLTLKHQILADNDKTQSLIPNFFRVSSNNNVIVGRDGGDSDTNGSNKGSGDVLE